MIRQLMHFGLSSNSLLTISMIKLLVRVKRQARPPITGLINKLKRESKRDYKSERIAGRMTGEAGDMPTRAGWRQLRPRPPSQRRPSPAYGFTTPPSAVDIGGKIQIKIVFR